MPAGFREISIMRSYHVNAGKARAYNVSTAADVSSCCALLEELIESRTALVITTPTVAKLLGRENYNRLRSQNPLVRLTVLNCNEASKSIEQVLLICDEAMQVGLDRTGLLVGIGGGICTDIVTVAASLDSARCGLHPRTDHARWTS